LKAPLVALSLFFVLSVPLFAYQTPKKTPTFAEESAPDGKALIYIYYPAGGGSPLFFSNSGPLAILTAGSYFTYAVDPETVRLWVSFGVNAKSVKVSTVAGQAYYVRFGGLGLSLEVVTADRAKKDEEILFCEKVQE